MIDIIGDQLVLGVKEFPVGANWLDTDAYQSSWVIRRAIKHKVVFVPFEIEQEPLDGKETCHACKRRRPYSYFGRDERNKERHFCKSYCNECNSEQQAKRVAWGRAGKPGNLEDFEYEWKPRREVAA